ncbi:MAG TPA: class I tRNA ligase family protein [Longimicrobium sp.]
MSGPDILFFWIARMIMAGLEFRGQVPFGDVKTRRRGDLSPRLRASA